MARTSAGRNARGHTLVEITVTSAIFVLIMGGVLTLIRDAGGVFRMAVSASDARRHCAGLATTLADEITHANPTSLTIDHTHAEGDRIVIQLPLSTVNGQVSWGAPGHFGGMVVRHATSSVEYLLVPDPAHSRLWQLVRRVIDAHGVATGDDEVVLEHVDAVDKTRGSGFRVTQVGRLITIDLRVRHADDSTGISSQPVVRFHSFTVQLRNS